MAIILNMLPVEQKPNMVAQNTNNKCDAKGAKSESGFAKALTSETDKNGMDTEAKGKTDDNAQLMAAMAGMTGMLSPIVPNLVSLDQNQVAGNAIDGFEKVVSNMENPLLNLEPGLATPKDATVGSVPVQAGVPNVVTELANTEKGSLDTQVVSPVSNIQPSKLSNIANGMDNSQQQLAGVVAKMTAVSPQLDPTQLRDNVAAQAQLQNIVRVQGKTQKNTDVVIDNPIVLNALSTATLVNAASSLKNSNKQIDGKKVVADQENIDATAGMKNLGAVTTVDVKPVVAPQNVVTVVDELIGKDKENVDVILPNQTAKDSDSFASILNQQGLKIEHQTGTSEVKPQPVSDPYNVKSQIVDQARLVAGNKNTEMIIQLKPEHLGELTFKVSVENGIVSASFHSNNAEVRSTIESSLYLLKQEMSNQGLKVDNVGVYAGLGEFFSNGQQREGHQQPTVKINNNKTEEDFIDALESVDPVKSSLDATGVDYLV